MSLLNQVIDGADTTPGKGIPPKQNILNMPFPADVNPGDNKNPGDEPDKSKAPPVPPTPPTPPAGKEGDNNPPAPPAGGGDDAGAGTGGDDNNGDDLVLYVNDNGDYVDGKGEVVIKKEDAKFGDNGELLIPEDMMGPSVTEVLRDGLTNILGIELKDEKGAPLVFEDTNEGAIELFKVAVEKGIAQKQQELNNQYPILNDFTEHIMAGNDPRSFFDVEAVWQTFKMPAAADMSDQANNIRKNVILENLKQGFGYYNAPADKRPDIEKRAKNYLDMVSDTGKLLEEGDNAYNDLVGKERSLFEQRKAANQAAIEADKAEDAKYWNTVGDLIKTGKIGNLLIPESERSSFLSYIRDKVPGKGVTAETLDVQNEDSSNSLQLAYWRYKKFDLDALIQIRAQQLNAGKISLRKAKYKVVQGGREGGSGGTSTGTLSPANINISDFVPS